MSTIEKSIEVNVPEKTKGSDPVELSPLEYANRAE